MLKKVKRLLEGLVGLFLAQTLGISGEIPLPSKLQASPPGIEVERDVEYGRAGEHLLKLDIYRAKAPPPELLPAIVMIHGGGWRSWPDGKWTKSTDAEIARAFAAKGYWVASVDYRLSDVAPFPAAFLDCKRAVRWVRSHAADLKVDPERIGVWGFSAGGHLALLVGCADPGAGIEPGEDGPPASSRVRAVASWAGLTDLADPSGPRKLEGEREELARKFLGGTFQEKPETYRKASPILYAGKDNPPTLLVHGDQDERVPYSHSQAMLERQRQAGVDVTLLTVKGGGHLFFKEEGQNPPLSGMIDRTVRFFDRTLKTPRVLVLTHSAGFVHEVVRRPSPEKLSLVEEQIREALKGQCRLVLSQDPRDVTAQNLKGFQAVVFYTSGDLPIEKEALLEYVRGGGGFACVHNGMATLMKYPPYGEMVGASFDGHPWDQEVTVRVEDEAHPSTAHLGGSFRIRDEIYQVKNWDRRSVRVLLSVDPSSVDLAKGKRADQDYALAWTKSYGEGRVFYTALGHYPDLWKDERVLKHLVGGVQWVLGRDR
jgi:acetyl esterase/lipase/type 1 glutamine amidotransferase